MKASSFSMSELLCGNPLGCLAMAASLISGSTCLATVLVPSILLTGEQLAARSNDGPSFWITVLGSGIVWPLVLLSVALEKKAWPAVVAIIFLFASENMLFPIMPFWTVMLLGGLSGWAVFLYVTAMLIALVLLVRRAIRGSALAHAKM